MEVLSDMKSTQQVLNYAVNRDRGQSNQQEIIKAKSNCITVSYVRQKRARSILPLNSFQKSVKSRNCGILFSRAQLQTIPARNTQISLCKKVGQFPSLCTALLCLHRNPR